MFLVFQESVDGIWLDFNLPDKILTWYCTKDSFNPKNMKNEEDAVSWTLITLLISDVESINILS